jgi:predicted acylesterase/phospholipase RssA
MNRQPKKSIKLALQGGGSHGAFTWGVLDRLLEDERVHIAAVSGTSAGAMNAVALADGMARGGPAEARKCLEKFWSAYQRRSSIQPDPTVPFRRLFGELEPGRITDLYPDGSPFAGVFSIRSQPVEFKSVARRPRPLRRLRPRQRSKRSEIIFGRNQCS